MSCYLFRQSRMQGMKMPPCADNPWLLSQLVSEVTVFLEHPAHRSRGTQELPPHPTADGLVHTRHWITMVMIPNCNLCYFRNWLSALQKWCARITWQYQVYSVLWWDARSPSNWTFGLTWLPTQCHWPLQQCLHPASDMPRMDALFLKIETCSVDEVGVCLLVHHKQFISLSCKRAK